jgi:hypothetical protein
VELDTEYCKLAASRLMHETTTVFGNAQLQIELKPYSTAERVATLQESPPARKTRKRGKSSRR